MDERIYAEKQALRQALRAQTEALPAAYVARSDLGMQRNVLSLNVWKQAQTVFLYVSVGREPDTHGLLRLALAAGKTVAVPRTLMDGRMEACIIESMDELWAGRFGIPEPDAAAETLRPDDIDLVVAPCVAADRQEYRLGHGGGYYDRYLARSRCAAVCLCRERLLQTALPHDEFDRPVDIVVTERACIVRR